MIIKRLIATTALAASFATASFAAMPAPASADETSTAITAGIAGLVVGALLFDHNSNQYYYVNNGRRRYVDNDTARVWYQRRDPGYYDQHRYAFDRDRGQFAQSWNRDHGYNDAQGYRDRDDRRHDGDDRH